MPCSFFRDTHHAIPQLLGKMTTCLKLPRWKYHVLSFTRSVRTLRPPRTAACQPPLSCTVSQSLLKFVSIESVTLSNHLILCCLLLLLPSAFPIIKVFSNVRWPKYWRLDHLGGPQICRDAQGAPPVPVWVFSGQAPGKQMNGLDESSPSLGPCSLRLPCGASLRVFQLKTQTLLSTVELFSQCSAQIPDPENPWKC